MKRGVPYALTKHQPEILSLARDQLVSLYGPAMAEPLALEIMDWAGEPLVSTARDRQAVLSHPSPGLPAILTQIWNGRLRFGSTETAPGSPGYLEGALEAAAQMAPRLTNSFTCVLTAF